MTDGAAFPGDSVGMDGQEMLDRSDMWKEYRAIRTEADKLGTESLVRLGEGAPRDAEVLATLSVSSRLEALAYLISKQRSY